MFLRFLWVKTCIRTSFLSPAGKYSPARGVLQAPHSFLHWWTVVLLTPFADREFAVMNVCAHALVWVPDLNSLEHRLEKGVAGSYDNCAFHFLRGCQTVQFPNSWTIPKLFHFVCYMATRFLLSPAPLDGPVCLPRVSGNSLRQNSGIQTCVLKRGYYTWAFRTCVASRSRKCAELPHVCSGLGLETGNPHILKKNDFSPSQ